MEDSHERTGPEPSRVGSVSPRTYRGYIEGNAVDPKVVLVTDAHGTRPLPHPCVPERGDFCHSPTGWAWGYRGERRA